MRVPLKILMSVGFALVALAFLLGIVASPAFSADASNPSTTTQAQTTAQQGTSTSIKEVSPIQLDIAKKREQRRQLRDQMMQKRAAALQQAQ